jgi:hypothetical protein
MVALYFAKNPFSEVDVASVVPMYSWLVQGNGRSDLFGDWTWLRAVRAHTLRMLGRIDEAILDARECSVMLEARSVSESRRELHEVREWLLRQFGSLLTEC